MLFHGTITFSDVQTKNPKTKFGNNPIFWRGETFIVGRISPENSILCGIWYTQSTKHSSLLCDVWYTNPIKVSSARSLWSEDTKPQKLQFWISEWKQQPSAVLESVCRPPKKPLARPPLHDTLSGSSGQHVLLLQITYRRVHPRTFFVPHLHCEVWSAWCISAAFLGVGGIKSGAGSSITLWCTLAARKKIASVTEICHKSLGGHYPEQHFRLSRVTSLPVFASPFCARIYNTVVWFCCCFCWCSFVSHSVI